MSNNLRIVKVFSELIGLKLFSAVLSVLYGVLQIKYFGSTGTMDAYFIAFSLIYIVTSSIQGGQMTEFMLPRYVELLKSGNSRKASLFVSGLMNRVLVLLLLGLFIIWLVAPFLMNILAQGLDSSRRDFAVLVFRVSAGLIILNFITAVLNTVLNAEQIYGKSELTGVINSSVSLVLLVLLHDRLGVYTLILSLYVGRIVEVFTGLIFLKRSKFQYALSLNRGVRDYKELSSVLMSTTSYTLSTQSYSVALTWSASFLGEGYYSTFTYIVQIGKKLRGLIIGPLSNVFFTKFSIRKGLSENEMISFLVLPLRMVTKVSLLIFVAIVFFGRDFLLLLDNKAQHQQLINPFAYYVLVAFSIDLLINSVGVLFRKSSIVFGEMKRLYYGWSLAQLLTGLFALTSIHLWGEHALITVPIFNSLCISYVALWVCLKCFTSHSKRLFRELLLLLFQFVVVGMLTLGLIFLHMKSDYNLIWVLGSKLIVFLLICSVILKDMYAQLISQKINRL